MTGKQNAVMWLGFLLVLVRLFTTGQWSAIWSAVGNSQSGTGGPPALGNVGSLINTGVQNTLAADKVASTVGTRGNTRVTQA